jgi:hypothetical protein
VQVLFRSLVGQEHAFRYHQCKMFASLSLLALAQVCTGGPVLDFQDSGVLDVLGAPRSTRKSEKFWYVVNTTNLF